MGSEAADWKQAFEVYRAGRIELEKWRGLQLNDVGLEFRIEELKDELLDLKHATMAEDAARVVQSAAAVMLLLVELQHRSEGDE